MIFMLNEYYLFNTFIENITSSKTIKNKITLIPTVPNANKTLIPSVQWTIIYVNEDSSKDILIKNVSYLLSFGRKTENIKIKSVYQ